MEINTDPITESSVLKVKMRKEVATGNSIPVRTLNRWFKKAGQEIPVIFSVLNF